MRLRNLALLMSLLSDSDSAIYYYYHLIRINCVHFLSDSFKQSNRLTEKLSDMYLSI